MPLHVFGPLLLAALVFAVMPGPAMLYAAAQTMARGRRAGLASALGLHLGGYFYVVATALGLSALLAYVPSVYLAVKLAGATYLVWLGIDMIRRRNEKPGAGGIVSQAASRAFLQSVTVEILNPKTAIFYVAFLPQFVTPGAALPAAVQFLLLGTLVNVTFTSADLVTVLLASTLLRRFGRGGRGQAAARVAGGSVLIGLGGRLAVDHG